LGNAYFAGIIVVSRIFANKITVLVVAASVTGIDLLIEQVHQNLIFCNLKDYLI
jgi:hypothetical protein